MSPSIRIHESFYEDSQCDPNMFENAIPFFYDEHYADSVPNLHYEGENSYFVFPNKINVNLFGQTNESNIYSLPQGGVNENKFLIEVNFFVNV